MNSSELGHNPGASMLHAYKYRLFMYLGAVMMAIGILGLPHSKLVVTVLAPGVLQYLAFSIPAALVTFISFMVSDRQLPEKMFGLSMKAIVNILIVIGVMMLAWGWFGEVPFWGPTGLTVILWGAEFSLLPNESMYWQERRNRRRERT